MSGDGSTLLYSTYIGSSVTEWAYGIDIDSEYNAYITGYTMDAYYPTTLVCIMCWGRNRCICDQTAWINWTYL